MYLFYNDILAITIARHAGKVALVQEGSYVTFRELDSLADAIGRALRDDGIGHGDIVPIVLPRGIAPVAAAIGAWKIGAAVVILNPDEPRRRLGLMIDKCSARVILDHEWLRSHRVADGPPPPAPETIPTPSDTAMVVFVSGSNGHPKGVTIPHRTLAQAVRIHALGRGERDVFVSLSPFSTMSFEIEVLTPLALGGTVHLPSDAVISSPEAVARYVREAGVTTAVMDTNMAGPFLNIADGDCKSIILHGGHADGLFSVLTQIQSSYGLTETCGPVASFEIDAPRQDVPLGRPLAGYHTVILDDNLRPVANGQEGEICVSGPIATGYLNNPALTARRFVQDPYSADPAGEVMFRTGDRGRMDADGILIHCGRHDRVVRIAGRRVEPGEVEVAMLEASPLELDGAVVAAFPGGDGEFRLHAWYTAPRPIEAESAILPALADVLPTHMLPVSFTQVQTFPRSNGRIDIQALYTGYSGTA